MRVEWRLLAGLGLILSPWAILYWIFSYEPAGTAALVLTAAMFLFLAVYLAVQARQHGLRPEDREAVDLAEGAADLGWFPSASWYPVLIAVACMGLGYGLVLSPLLALPGVALLVFAIAGLAVESHRGTRVRPRPPQD